MNVNLKIKKYSLRLTPQELESLREAATTLHEPLPRLIVTAVAMVRDRCHTPSDYLQARALFLAMESEAIARQTAKPKPKGA